MFNLQVFLGTALSVCKSFLQFIFLPLNPIVYVGIQVKVFWFCQPVSSAHSGTGGDPETIRNL